jgi:hypothetical protein
MEIDRQHRRQNIVCYNCGRNGHVSRDCRARRNNNQPAQVRQARQDPPRQQPQPQQNQIGAGLAPRAPPPPQQRPRQNIRAMLESMDNGERDEMIEELVNMMGT